MKQIATAIAFVCFCFSCTNDSIKHSDKRIKIALRDIGDKLLLMSKDSVSVVKPVIALTDNTYQLSFEKALVINPDSLVSTVKTSFKKANISEHYITEVLECHRNEVAYSYEIKFDMEQSLVPCSGRELQKACYTIQIQFTEPVIKVSKLFYVFAPLILVAVAFFLFRKNPKSEVKSISGGFNTIGHFKFYPEQNKLVKEAEEITLSKKECELLAIFVARPNEIIKREELTKRVWEDNGVVVGRSLDTYISKLRKKLQTDETIKLTNVHGVGYKLEIT
ncbi:winged helix-turn-helix domain-containing protein [Hyunsoonleella flava]|nr:winged helix-turn-helix domain-containing protein [Hyunsoonleella flava]